MTSDKMLFERFKPEKRRFSTISAILCLWIAVGQSGCRPAKTVEPEPTSEKTVLVRSLTIVEGEPLEIRSFPIFAKEGQTAQLSFRVVGQLENFDVKIGQSVKKDEIVAVLDQRDYQLAVARIEKSVVEAEAALKAMKTGARAEDVASLESQLAAAASTFEQAEKQFQRMENLKKDEVATDVQYDIAKTARDAAQSAKESLANQLTKAKTGSREEEIEMMEAKIDGLNIDLTLARNKLADTELKAPFDGVIAEKFFDNHEVVAPGIPVLSIVGANELEATLSVPENVVRKKDDIQKIECSFDSLPNLVFDASVKEIGSSVQKGNLAYPLTIRIQKTPIASNATNSPESSVSEPSVSLNVAESNAATLALTDESNAETIAETIAPTTNADSKNAILSGMVGTATLQIAGNDRSIQIPTAALFSAVDSDRSSFVWLIDSQNQTIKRQTVQTGLFKPNGVQIVSGLKPGDRIVVAGTRFLKEGQKVRWE